MLGVKEFKEKFRADKVFAKKFENAKTPGDVVSLAGQEGFSFTVDDLVDALEDTLKNRELTDAELDAVAGGGPAAGWTKVGEYDKNTMGDPHKIIAFPGTGIFHVTTPHGVYEVDLGTLYKML